MLRPELTNPPAAIDPATLRRAFGAFSSGVVAVAAEVDGELAGMAASSFTSVSLTPALLDEAVATFECSIFREVEAGDHTMVLLQLHAVSDHGEVSPLVFHRPAFSRLAG